MENSASDLSDLQKKKLSSLEQLSDAYDIYNQRSTSGTKTLDAPPNWTDSEYHTSMVQASEDIIAAGQPSSNQISKRGREDIEKKYHDRQRAKVQRMKMMSEYNEMFPELQKLKLEQERYINLKEQMCRQLQSDSKMIEQLRSIVGSLTSSNASLNLQLDSLYGNVLEVDKTKSELKAEKDELKRENEYLKNHLNRWENENVQWNRDNEYRKNKDKLRREEENLNNLLAEKHPVHLGFGDQEPSKVNGDLKTP